MAQYIGESQHQTTIKFKNAEKDENYNGLYLNVIWSIEPYNDLPDFLYQPQGGISLSEVGGMTFGKANENENT